MLRHRLADHLLTIDITETAALSAGAILDRVVAAPSAAGVAFSIDDFGTGHSSLVRVARSAASKIETDRSFVSDMKRAKLPVAAICIVRTRSLGLRVIAEGIEDAETIARLLTLGCDIGRGYPLSTPVTRDELSRWMHLHKDVGASVRGVPEARPTL